MRPRLRPGLAIVFVVASFVCVAATSAAAQNYPDHLIKIIVPFAAGGPVDVMARLVAQRMAPILRQSVIIENRAGGGGVIGAKAAAATLAPWARRRMPGRTTAPAVPSAAAAVPVWRGGPPAAGAVATVS